MENTLSAGASCGDGRLVRDISLEHLQIGIVFVLLQITTPTHCQTVEHPNAAAFAYKAVNQMAPDEACAARHDVKA